MLRKSSIPALRAADNNSSDTFLCANLTNLEAVIERLEEIARERRRHSI